MKKLILLAFFMLGCAHCSPKDSGPEPYIRTQPGIEYCGSMCDKFKELKCTGYYEDIPIDCSSDPAYATMAQCAEGGMSSMTCKEFCEYEMKNSVQLDPMCLSQNLVICSEIETLCNH